MNGQQTDLNFLKSNIKKTGKMNISSRRADTSGDSYTKSLTGLWCYSCRLLWLANICRRSKGNQKIFDLTEKDVEGYDQVFYGRIIEWSMAEFYQRHFIQNASALLICYIAKERRKRYIYAGSVLFTLYSWELMRRIACCIELSYGISKLQGNILHCRWR